MTPCPLALVALAATAALAHAQSWRVVGPEPAPRSAHSMAWDPVSGRLLTFGGQDGEFTVSGTTAVRVGTRWNQLPVASPSPRMGYLMAADEARGRVVVVSGTALFASQPIDVHEWDGSVWRNVTPPVMPQGGTQMCWHGGTGRIVLYGAGSSVPNETWLWDGSAWTQRFPAHDPGVRRGAVMAYDLARDRIVLWGGRNAAFTSVADTWEWDGVDWIDVQPAVEPPPQSGFMLAHDPLRARTVLLGNGTWEFDGATWVQRTPLHSPSARVAFAMAMDLGRGRIVLNGGRSGTQIYQYHGDTWEWDGADWTQVDGTSGPGPRNYAKVAYEPTSGGVLLHGGQRQATIYADTWRFDGRRWTQLASSGAQPLRTESELCGDDARGQVLAYPAGDPSGPRTWVLQNGSWTQLAPPQEPPLRFAHALAYDPVRAVTVLFGGFDPATRGLLNDTWEWDGVTWTQTTGTNPVPPARSQHRMAADPAGGGVLLFGGFGPGLLGDTWRYTGSGWQPVANSGPSARWFHGLAADWMRARVVLVGGLDAASQAPSDHWEWDGSQWSPAGPVPEATTWYLAESRRGAVLQMDGLTYELIGSDARATPYGSGCAGLAGVPRLAGGGLPMLGATAFQVVLDRARSSSLALVVASFTPQTQPGGTCGPLVVSPVTVLSAVTSATGIAQWTIAIPDAPILRGVRLSQQAAVLDPAGAFLGAVALTNGLELRLDY